MNQPADPIPALSALLDQLAGTPAPAAAAPPAPDPDAGQEPDADAPQPLFADLDAFMRGYLTVVVERRVTARAANGVHWCPQWWQHPEAITRLYALWRAWEALRISDPTFGMALWWRDHFDPHFAVLTGELGPFRECGPDREHVPPAPLPCAPAPAEILAQLPDFHQDA